MFWQPSMDTARWMEVTSICRPKKAELMYLRRR